MIKFLSLAALCSITLWACKKDEVIPGSVIGSWKITEQLIDPGDGSGTFTTVNSNKKITFKANGTFSSNFSVCTAGNSTAGNSSGTYNEVSHIINTNDCGEFGEPVTFAMENGVLIIVYPCDEACMEKFERI